MQQSFDMLNAANSGSKEEKVPNFDAIKELPSKLPGINSYKTRQAN
jgi:hypothetical protein